MKLINRFIKKAVIGYGNHILLTDTNEVWYVPSEDMQPKYLPYFRDITDIAVSGDKTITCINKYGFIITGDASGNSFKCKTLCEAVSVDGCTGHWAAVMKDGSIYAWEDEIDIFDNLVFSYKEKIEKWRNIKQIVLTPQCALGLASDGKIICSSDYYDLNKIFQTPGKEIVQIAAFGYRYLHTAAVLYDDGTVRAFYGNFKKEIDEVRNWSNIAKIGCGGHGAIVALNKDGIMTVNLKYKNMNDKTVKKMKNITDISVKFGWIIAIDKDNELNYLYYTPLFNNKI